MAIDATKIRIDANRGRSLVQDFDLGGAVTIGNIVYIAADDDVEVTDANAAATSMAIGMLVALAGSDPSDTVGASGDRGTVCLLGLVSCSGWGLTPGAIYYVSETAGAITATKPSGAGTWSWAIGYAIDANTLFIQPGLVAPVSNS
jgi:hypothetical protein